MKVNFFSFHEKTIIKVDVIFLTLTTLFLHSIFSNVRRTVQAEERHECDAAKDTFVKSQCIHSDT